jgi:hypothetical protein
LTIVAEETSKTEGVFRISGNSIEIKSLVKQLTKSQQIFIFYENSQGNSLLTNKQICFIIQNETPDFKIILFMAFVVLWWVDVLIILTKLIIQNGEL